MTYQYKLISLIPSLQLTLHFLKSLIKRESKNCLLFMFLSAIVSFPGTNLTGQDTTFCATVIDSTHEVYTLDTTDSGTDKIYVKLYLHVIRKDDGSGGLTDAQVKQSLDNLAEDFEPYNIEFLTDCVVNYIDSTDQYNDINGDPGIWSVNNHDDGIDLYFYPHLTPPVLDGFGGTSNTPGSEIFIAGYYKVAPFPPLYQTPILTHEMGHAFGLYHTHQVVPFCQEAIDGSDCGSCGDKICDTPADPGLNDDVDPNTCSWNTPITDGEGTPYVPDTLNYMSYTHIDCMEHFTNQQKNVMRNNLKDNEDISSVVFDFDFNTHVIDTSTNWTTGNLPNGGKVTVSDSLVISPGAILTISTGVQVRFGPEAVLIVKQGAKLSLYGTLTGFCGKSWKGVQVWGDSYEDQTTLQGGLLSQGAFTSFGGAIVENAEFGVRLWGPGSGIHTGGIISSTNTVFRNNPVVLRLHDTRMWMPVFRKLPL